ncbi:MAG: glutathione S-transferase N-terminal domain-containing protein [Pseudomonadota bacterium]
MTYQLFDLAMADRDLRISPFCWLVKFAMLHKGVEFETTPLCFSEKENYPDPEYGKLPVLKAGDELIRESAQIVAFLEKEHPETPLTATSGEAAAADFYNAWVMGTLFSALAPMLMGRVYALVDPSDKAYFRETREARFGVTLEELAAMPGAAEKAESVLQTLSAPLVRHKFLGGETPNLSDYIVFSPLLWQLMTTSDALYETPQPVAAWIERMLDLFDGYARTHKPA